MMKCLSCVLLALSANMVAAAAEKKTSPTHPFSIHDMLAMDRIGDPQVSPSGKRIVLVRRKTDLEANRGRTDLWLVDVDGSGLRRLTSHPAGEWNPRWSPDGQFVWFLSSRSGLSQVWKIAADGGEAVQASDLPLDVSALALSPDGSHLAMAMDVYPDADVATTRTRLDEIAAGKTSGLIFDRLFIRHWDTWKDGRRAHLFVARIPRDADRLISLHADGQPPIDVMLGMDADCPNKPFGGPEDFTFTPDGKSIVFSARDAGRTEPWSTDFDLYAAPIDGSAKPRCLTDDNLAWDAQPSFSPDGNTLAYLAMSRPGYESDRFRIVLRPMNGSPSRVLTENWDHSAGSIVWSADSNTIFATASNKGQRSLFAIDVATGNVRTVVREGTVGGVGLADQRLVFGLDSLASPVELYSVRPDGSEVQPITRINATKMAAARIGEYEQFTFKGWNDELVHAYAIKPIDFDPAKTYPVAFLIHGGPQGSFGNHFHYRWNPQVYTGAGYAVVMVDFHGSVGYGQAFCDSIGGDWGGKPLVDLQKGLAAALARYSWMDGDHVAALGASFGGFMINWIAGNWPDRFRCLINHDGNLDERLAYYNTEELWFPEWDHRGTPWDNPQGYQKHNPIDYVKNWKTPMLVIHGALDYRVVETQGMATFTALQRRGIPSKLLYFPDENHWVLQPANGILWHDTVISWMNRWTKESASGR